MSKFIEEINCYLFEDINGKKVFVPREKVLINDIVLSKMATTEEAIAFLIEQVRVLDNITNGGHLLVYDNIRERGLRK